MSHPSVDVAGAWDYALALFPSPPTTPTREDPGQAHVRREDGRGAATAGEPLALDIAVDMREGSERLLGRLGTCAVLYPTGLGNLFK